MRPNNRNGRCIGLIEKIIDIIFPRRCPICDGISRDGLACDSCKGKIKHVNDPFCIKCGKPLKNPSIVKCEDCTNKNMSYNENRAVFVYDDYMRKSIYRFKYGGRREYAAFYAKEIFSMYEDKIASWKPDVIIPIPIHKSKLKKRGYNQAYLIAKELSYLTKIPVDTKVVYRDKKTEIQKNLGATERSFNLKNAFKMNSNGVQYLSAMLIDDIYTTGATMCSVANILRDGGFADVYCISVCIGTSVQ